MCVVQFSYYWPSFCYSALALSINLLTPPPCGAELELELIQTQMAQKPMLRAEVGMRVVAQTKQVRNDSGGRGALAKFLGKFAKIEEFVGVAHSAEQ